MKYSLIGTLCFLYSLTTTPFVQAQDIKSPSAFLGYELGTHFTYHHKVIEYYNYVASLSDKVLIHEYGITNERRTLEVAYISSPENLKNIDDIRKNNLKRAHLMEGQPNNADIAIVWLSYNVHGNEANSTETAMKVLYELAGKNDPKYNSWLEKLVIILDPCLNPDGRDRYVNWYNQVVSSSPNSNIHALEHHENWRQGRSNHYLFDLNRDWVWQTQIESKQRLKLYNSWMPQVHVDFHEQYYNSQYYFAPAAQPMHELITPWQKEFQATVGKNNAKYFDEKGWLYFTREVFDLLYPGYGDSYPTFNGAVGMTYEMPGHSTAGLAVVTDKGDTLTLNKRIDMHFTTSMATLEICYASRQALINEFSNYFITDKDQDAYYVLKSNKQDRIVLLMELLDKNMIQYRAPSDAKTLKGFSYKMNEFVNVALDTLDLVVPLDQPKSTLVKALFERNTKLVDSLTYDITAWSLPFVYGLDAYLVNGKLDLKDSPINYATLKTVENPYAYVLNWTSIKDAQFLSALLKKGFKLNYSTKSFVYNSKKFNAGTLIIDRIDNEKSIPNYEAVLIKIASQFQRNLVPVFSGSAISSMDLGSQKINFLNKPKIALVSGESISTLGFGELWHFFDQEINFPIDIIALESMNSAKMNDYDVILFASGDYIKFEDEAGFKTLDDWIMQGGNLVLFEEAINGFIGEGKFGLKKNEEKEKEPADAVMHPFEQQERESLKQYIQGGIIEVAIDNSHPLAYGYDKQYYTLKNNSATYQFLPEGWNVGYIPTKDKVIAGYVGSDSKEKLNKNLVFGVEKRGAGKVIYFIDDPLFRAFWQNGKLFVANAVFFNN